MRGVDFPSSMQIAFICFLTRRPQPLAPPTDFGAIFSSDAKRACICVVGSCVGNADDPLVLYIHSPEDGRSSHNFNELMVTVALAMREKALAESSYQAKQEQSSKNKERGRSQSLTLDGTSRGKPSDSREPAGSPDDKVRRGTN